MTGLGQRAAGTTTLYPYVATDNFSGIWDPIFGPGTSMFYGLRSTGLTVDGWVVGSFTTPGAPGAPPNRSFSLQNPSKAIHVAISPALGGPNGGFLLSAAGPFIEVYNPTTGTLVGTYSAPPIADFQHVSVDSSRKIIALGTEPPTNGWYNHAAIIDPVTGTSITQVLNSANDFVNEGICSDQECVIWMVQSPAPTRYGFFASPIWAWKCGPGGFFVQGPGLGGRAVTAAIGTPQGGSNGVFVLAQSGPTGTFSFPYFMRVILDENNVPTIACPLACLACDWTLVFSTPSGVLAWGADGAINVDELGYQHIVQQSDPVLLPGVFYEAHQYSGCLGSGSPDLCVPQIALGPILGNAAPWAKGDGGVYGRRMLRLIQ